jgi:hypothetical protein
MNALTTEQQADLEQAVLARVAAIINSNYEGYSDMRVTDSLDERHAVARRTPPPYSVRKQLRDATLGVGASTMLREGRY